jgi:hypothetical protein
LLWLTQTVDGDLRLLTQMHSRDDNLFQLGPLPAWQALRKGPLRLRPRDSKSATVRGDTHEINQAGDHGILVDPRNHAVYYAIHVNQTYYDFILSRGYNNPQTLAQASPVDKFPVGTLQVKSSWRIVNQGEPTSSSYTTTAEIRRLKTVQGHVIVDPDPTRVDRKLVALVGLHAAGVVEGHPEFIWATFELQGNAPLLPQGMPPSSPNPVSATSARFYTAQTPAKDCNQSNGGAVTLIDPMAQTLNPVTEVFRQVAWGGGSDTAQIQALNQSVHQQLGADIAANYDLIGSLWSAGPLQPNITPGPPQGSVRLANTTMETFRQSVGNCFSCHDTHGYEDAGTKFPPIDLNLSHALRQTFLMNQRLQQTPSPTKVPKAPTK